MDAETLALIEKSIITTVDKIAGMAETAVPGFAPEIIVGQAVIDAVPEIASVINSWVNGAQPTDAERAAVAKEIHDLVVDPEDV
jgi:hypothetical protein